MRKNSTNSKTNKFRLLDLDDKPPENKELEKKGVAKNKVKKPIVCTLPESFVLRVKKQASLYIPDIKLRFKKPKDCYPIELLKAKFGQDIFEKSAFLKRLLSSGILEITTFEKSQEEAEKLQKRLDILKRRNENNDVNGILIDKFNNPVPYSKLGGEKMANKGNEDPVEIDISENPLPNEEDFPF